jgi:eukaryotic-like serine/threonine-protein kinase
VYRRPLGRGAGGAVYLASDLRKNGRRVALKVLSAEACSTVQGKMIRREFEVLSKLDHPNLVRVYDYGSLPDGGVFLAEEYIDGFSLQDARALLEPKALIDVTLQLLEGLSYIHGMGMIHRDVKPANVMLLWLDDESARPIVKLVDFGLSSMDPKRDTLRGGTRSYMAPEIIRGKKGGFRSDLYSLGVTLYYAMCGVLPFGPRKQEDPPPTEEGFRPPEPHRLNPDVPLSLSRFTMALLRQIPEFEYMDAGEALQALAGDTDSLEWIMTGQLANSMDIAAPAVLRGYFERGVLARQDTDRDLVADDVLGNEGDVGKLRVLQSQFIGVCRRLLREVACVIKISGVMVVHADCKKGMSAFELVLNILLPLIEMADSRGAGLGSRYFSRINMLRKLGPLVGGAIRHDRIGQDYGWVKTAIEEATTALEPKQTVILIEDFHIGDEDSLIFLMGWYQSSAAHVRPELICTAARGTLDTYKRSSVDIGVFDIAGLHPDDVDFFFRKRLGIEELTEDWCREVVEVSGRDPLYVEELSRHLIDTGILSRSSSISWKIDIDDLRGCVLPKGRRESIQRRLLALGTYGRETLELLALIHEPVDWPILRKLLFAGGKTSEVADQTIETLRWRHFIKLELIDDQRLISLIDPELGDVILERMNDKWRQSLHRRIGDRLSKVWKSTGQGAVFAARHLMAGRHQTAPVMFEIAGDEAFRSSDFRGAGEAYLDAVRLQSTGSGSAMLRLKMANSSRCGSRLDDAVDHLELAWNEAQVESGDWLKYRSCLQGLHTSLQIRDMKKADVWNRRLKKLAPEFTKLCAVRIVRAALRAAKGKPNQAAIDLKKIITVCRKEGNSLSLMRANLELAQLLLAFREFEAAGRYLDDAVQLARNSEASLEMGTALCAKASLFRQMNRLEEGEQVLNEAFGVLDRYRSPLLSMCVRVEIAENHLASGDLDGAYLRAYEVCAISEEFPDTILRARGQFVLGRSFLGRDPAAALDLIRKAADVFRQSQFFFPYGAEALSFLGSTLSEAGESEESELVMGDFRRWSAAFGMG